MIDIDQGDHHERLTVLLETLGIETLLRVLIDVVEDAASSPEDVTLDRDPETERCYFAVEPLREIVDDLVPIRP